MVDAGNGVLRLKYNLCRVARAAVVGSIYDNVPYNIHERAHRREGRTRWISF
jgi:hypothetical protein